MPARKHALHVVNGPMARGVHDLALMLDAMTATEGGGGGAAAGGPAAATGRAGKAHLAAGEPADPPLPHVEGWKGAPLPPAIGSSWQEVAKGGVSAPARLRVAFSNLGCAVSEEVSALCKAAADVLAAAAAAAASAAAAATGSSGDGSRNSGLNAADSPASTVNIESPFDLEAAERFFFVVRAALFHHTFSMYAADDMATMKPEIQWNFDCRAATSSPIVRTYSSLVIVPHLSRQGSAPSKSRPLPNSKWHGCTHTCARTRSRCLLVAAAFPFHTMLTYILQNPKTKQRTYIHVT